MAESGGPVFEGVGRPESIGDKVRRGVQERFDDFKNKGLFVEKKWMDAYQRVVDATDPGLRKKALEKVRWVAVGVAKAQRIGTAVVDVVLRFKGLQNIFGGIFKLSAPGTSRNFVSDVNARMEEKQWKVPESRTNYTRLSDKDVRIFGVKQGLLGVAENTAGRLSLARRASAFMADIVGNGGEKVAQITNKILRGKPKVEATQA